MTWQSPETAPKTGDMILADAGYPWPVLACWNKYEQEWVYASFAMNYVDGTEDPYFETESEKTIKKWCPIPDLVKNNDR